MIDFVYIIYSGFFGDRIRSGFDIGYLFGFENLIRFLEEI